MAASFKMYVVKWFGPYKESDLPNDASNMIYLWTGKRRSNPSVKYCIPQYCGITGRGIGRFLDGSHKKDELMPKYRKCWIGKIIGGKRTTVKGKKKTRKNSAFERTESLVIYYLQRRKLHNCKCCVLNERKGVNPPSMPIGILNLFYKTNKEKWNRIPTTIKNLSKIIIWDGNQIIEGSC